MGESGACQSPCIFLRNLPNPPTVYEIIPTLAWPALFFFCYSLTEMLEAVDIACLEGHCVIPVFCMALEIVIHFSTAAKEMSQIGERWLTSSDTLNDVSGKACRGGPQGKKIKCWMFSAVACAKKRSWVLTQMKDPLRIILHFIAFCIALYCQLDLQWKNYTMLVFCFIMLLFLIFQNIRNVFIALCYGRKKNTSFLEVSQFLSKGTKKTTKNKQKQPNLVWNWWTRTHFPLFLEYPQVKVLAGKKSKRLTFLLIADCKNFLFSHLPKQGRLNMLEQHQEEKKKEINQWKESDDKTLTLPNWK